MEILFQKRAIFFTIIVLYLNFIFFNGILLLQHSPLDFPSFYYASVAAFTAGISPYAPGALTSLSGGTQVLPFFSPPAALIFLWPLHLMNFEAAKIAMIITNHLLILCFLYLFINKILKIGLISIPAVFILLYTLNFDPVYLNLNLGQISLSLLVLLMLAWYFYREKKAPWLTALPLAAAAVLKIYPALFIILFLSKKKFAEAAYFMLWIVFFILISLFAAPVLSWPDWLANAIPSMGHAKNLYGFIPSSAPWNTGLNGFTSRLFSSNTYYDPVFPNYYLNAAAPYFLSGLMVLFSFFAVFKQAKDSNADSEFCLFLLLMSIVSPLTSHQHLACVLPAVILALYRIISAGSRPLLFTAVIASIIMALPLPFFLPFFRGFPASILLSIKLFVMLSGWLFFMRCLDMKNNFHPRRG